MDVVAHILPLDANGGKVGDDEEASIVDVVSRDRIAGWPPVLGGKQRDQILAASRRVEMLDSILAINQAIGVGADREAMRALDPRREVAAVLSPSLDRPPVERFAEAGPQERNENLVLERRIGRRPVDVEPVSEMTARLPAQDVQPLRIFGAADAHVVRNDVVNDTESMCAKGPCHLHELTMSPKLGI